MQPPKSVLAEFGAAGPAVRLPGGRGSAWRAGNVVLKPLDVLPDELEWLHRNAPTASTGDGLRLGLPVESRTGRLVVDGWTASPLLEGEHGTGRWEEIAAVARRFAARFAGAERPAFLDERTHAWARADRLAWGEEKAAAVEHVPLLKELLEARRPVTESSGIIHGDLAGNVLFDDAQAPAVIDLTLYWRPVRYSVAIIAVDAVCFEGAPQLLLETIDPAEGFAQHLVRALVFRIATDWFNQRASSDLRVYRDVVARVLGLVAGG